MPDEQQSQTKSDRVHTISTIIFYLLFVWVWHSNRNQKTKP